MQPLERRDNEPESAGTCQAEDGTVQPGTEAAPLAEAAPAPKRRRRWPWVLAALLALALGGECVQRWRIERAIGSALERLELPYVLGAEGPDAYDCSSLVQRCFADAWLDTPRLAADIGYCERYRTIESRAQLLRGDVVCFDTVSDQDLSDHVGVYLGNNRFVHASSGKGKVVVSELTGYYEAHFSWGERLLRHAPVEIPFLLGDAEDELPG